MLRKTLLGAVAALAVLVATTTPASAGGGHGHRHHHHHHGHHGHHHHHHRHGHWHGYYGGYRPVPYYTPGYVYPAPPVYYNGYAPTYVPPAGIGFQNRNFSLWLGR